LPSRALALRERQRTRLGVKSLVDS
jgi:hypothetical protein